MQLQRSISLPALVLSRFEFRHSPRFFSFDFHRIASVFHRSTTTVPSVFPQIFFILRSTAFISATDIGKTTRSNRDYIDRKRKKKKKRKKRRPRIRTETRIYKSRSNIDRRGMWYVHVYLWRAGVGWAHAIRCTAGRGFSSEPDCKALHRRIRSNFRSVLPLNLFHRTLSVRLTYKPFLPTHPPLRRHRMFN